MIFLGWNPSGAALRWWQSALKLFPCSVLCNFLQVLFKVPLPHPCFTLNKEEAFLATILCRPGLGFILVFLIITLLSTICRGIVLHSKIKHCTRENEVFLWVFLRKDTCRSESWQPVSYVKHLAVLTTSRSGVERSHLRHTGKYGQTEKYHFCACWMLWRRGENVKWQ